jgi:hypothetical protein
MRKLIALVCAIAMVMALAVPALADVSPIWEIIEVVETSDDSSSDHDHKKSDDKAEETTTSTAANMVDAAVAAQAGAALEALLNGDLAGYKQLTGWMVPDLNVLKAELAKLTATDMKVVLFSNTGVASFVELTEVFAPAFNLNGVAAVTVVGK